MKITVTIRTRNEEDLIERWLLNRPYADEIILVDSESTDRTVELALKDPRVKHVPYTDGSVHPEVFFHNEGITKRLQFTESTGDWVEITDADEIPNLYMQEHIREYLETADLQKVVRIPFLYLCAGYEQFYTEPSQWTSPRIWHKSYLPDIAYADPTGHGEIFIGETQEAPAEFILLHLNWALEERFERKQKLYETVMGTPAWHPDEKFDSRAHIPTLAVFRESKDLLRYGKKVYKNT